MPRRASLGEEVPVNLAGLKKAVQERIEERRAELIEFSLRLHANPEMGFHETQAVAWLTEYLQKDGFRIEKSYCRLPTAFKASYGTGQPVVGLVAEYDALPKLGHACGHNIIATAALGAAVALRRVLKPFQATVVVVGAPAEELYGGKSLMVDRGGFAELEAAMMVHPAVEDTAVNTALACDGLDVEFFGKAAHAAARPDEGINALEALILAYNGINALRQQIRSSARVHGIITNGGEAANIVPAHSAAKFLVRAEDEAYLKVMRERVLNCFKGAAQATGARLKYKWDKAHYAPLRTNMVMAEVFAKNLSSLGRQVALKARREMGSTDMGNVTQIVPGIHPSIAIAPKTVLGHSPEFKEAAASEAGHRGLIDGAKAMAMTVLDLVLQPELLARAREEFEKAKKAKAAEEG